MDVRMPDGTVIKNVPEGTTQSDLQRRLQAYQGAAPVEAAPIEPQADKKFSLSLPGPLGMALDAGITGALSGVGMAASGYRGAAQGVGNLLGMDGTEAGSVTEDAQNALSVAPVSRQGRALASLHAAPFEWLAGKAHGAGDVVSEVTGSPALGAGVNTAIQAAPAIVGGRGTIGLSRRVGVGKGGAASKAPAAPRQAGLGGVPPTIEELGAQSKAAYKRASDAGVNIAPASFANLKSRVNAALTKEGIDPTLHPQTTAALKRINGTKGAVTLDQLETLRKIANDARGGGKADGRLAGKIVDELDNYTGNISTKDVTGGNPEGFAALKEARNLYSRKAKAEEISRLVKRAEDSAPNFSASGYENALRIQFKQLAMNDKKMRRFNPEEQATIRKVARGGAMENALRMLGKFAPTGVVSGMAAALASTVPGGIALPAAGLAARYGATRMTAANARLAEETMRRGPQRRPRNALIDEEQNALIP